MTVALMGTPKKDLTPDHPDTRAITKDIARILSLVTTDNSYPSGHEFSKIITNRTKYPKFRRIKTGIMLGHGHSPGTYIPPNKDPALGHGIGHSIPGMSVNNDISPYI